MKLEDMLPYNYDLYFEPVNPITTAREFTDELVKYFSEENICLTILEESMEPIIELEEQRYICNLGEPFRTCKLVKIPINPISARFLGYRWVYIYKC